MAWTRVQTFTQAAQFTGATVASTAVTLASAVAIGDTILVMTTAGVTDPTTLNSTLTDQLGNTYTRLTAGQGGQLADATDAQGTDAWWCIVTIAGTPTITYTHNPPGSNRAWTAIKGSHFTGSDGASTRNTSTGQFQSLPGTATDAISSTAGTTTVDGCLIWGCSGMWSSTTDTEVGGTGFTASALDTTSEMIDEYLTQSTQGSIAATFTDATNGALRRYSTIMIAITPSALVPGGWSLYRPYTLGAAINVVTGGLFYYWRRRKQEKPDE